MQPQFGSVQMVAGAYEQELRADAARVRPTRGARPAGSRRRRSRAGSAAPSAPVSFAWASACRARTLPP